jgi:FkbM family methyltransferase
MSAFEGFRTYFRLFGFRGAMLATKARLLNKQSETVVLVPGIKNPVCLRLRTTDISVFRQVLVTREYDWEFCKSPRIIIDAGANIGLTSVFYANKYPEAMIIAIEPESSNFQMLKKNTSMYANITPVQAALWKNDNEISLVDPHLGHYGFQTTELPKGTLNAEEYSRVRGVTLDKLMAEFGLDHIDILKVDIEGTEKEVFDNSSSWIGKVGVIIIEFHDQFRSGCAHSVYMAAKDFELEWRKGETVFLAKKEYVGEMPLCCRA